MSNFALAKAICSKHSNWSSRIVAYYCLWVFFHLEGMDVPAKFSFVKGEFPSIIPRGAFAVFSATSNQHPVSPTYFHIVTK